MDKNYNFIYELTTLCNFHCVYCSRRDVKDNPPWADLETSLKICDFFKELSTYISDEHRIRITLFGGEPTLVPTLKDIVKYLKNFNTRKIKYSIYTNLSADIDLYRYLLDNKCDITSTYHMNHTTLKDYKEKLETLLKEYPDNDIIASYVIGKNRIREEEIQADFKDFIEKYSNFELLLIPLLDNDGIYKIKGEEEIKQKEQTGTQDQLNHRRNKKYGLSECHNYIMYNGKMVRCNQLLNRIMIDTLKENSVKTYLNISKIKMKCEVPFCCYPYQE